MQFSFKANGDTTVLKQVTMSSTVSFDIPAPLGVLKAMIIDFLMQPETRDVINDGIMLDRNQSAIRISVGSGSFSIPYANLFPLVMS